MNEQETIVIDSDSDNEMPLCDLLNDSTENSQIDDTSVNTTTPSEDSLTTDATSKSEDDLKLATTLKKIPIPLKKPRFRIRKPPFRGLSNAYDDKGIHVETGMDLCDCLNENCPGCYYPCKKCASQKCGRICRVNRPFIWEEKEFCGYDYFVKHPTLK